MGRLISKWTALALLAILAGCVTTSGVVVPSTNYYDKKVVDLNLEVFRVPADDRPTVIVCMVQVVLICTTETGQR